MIRILALLIGLFLLNSLHAQDINKIKWEKDIKVLQKKLPEKHKYLFYVRNRVEFNNDIYSLLSTYKNLSNLGVALKMQQLVARMGDSHTNIGWDKLIDKSKQLPLTLYWFGDGIYVKQTVVDNKKMLGKRIHKINQSPIKEVVDSLSTLVVQDNIAFVKGQVPKLISNIELLEYFNFVKDGKVIVETEDLDGNLEKFEVKSSLLNKENRVEFEVDSVAFSVNNLNEFFVDKYFEKEEIYFIQYNKCNGRENPPYNFKGDINTLPSFIEFESRVIETINNKSIRKLIVDLRYNGGGNSYQGTNFIRNLSGIEKINQKGVLYVLIGRRTFSSAIINVMDFKSLTKATFVGEETGGKPNHFGEVKRFELPNSKIEVYYSTKFFRRAEKDVNTINPDVKVEESFDDFKLGIDPVFEWIKKQ